MDVTPTYGICSRSLKPAFGATCIGWPLRRRPWRVALQAAGRPADLKCGALDGRAPHSPAEMRRAGDSISNAGVGGARAPRCSVAPVSPGAAPACALLAPRHEGTSHVQRTRHEGSWRQSPPANMVHGARCHRRRGDNHLLSTFAISPLLPWILASLSAVLLFAAGVLAWLRQRQVERSALPTEWALTARPVFSADERRVYRQLREALPHHIVLSKLPLVRFCQPTDPQDVRFWYELLGNINVTFAICSANGRVLAAIDLDNERSSSRRTVQIKQSVLGSCRVRYLRCPVDHLPSVPELQLLVPQSAVSARAPQPARASATEAGSPVAGGAARRRATLWQDSSVFQDSFFGSGSRAESAAISDFGALRAAGELPSVDMTDASLDSRRSVPPLRH
jgi:Protein of unknown function (DUF2726)